VAQSLADRWQQLLADADRNFAADLKTLYANNSARGLLRSGATIKGSVTCYENQMTEAVDLCCQAISTRHSKGGFFWKRRFNDLRNFLGNHFDKRSGDIDPAIKMAGMEVDSSAGRAGRKLLHECRERLVQRVNDYADGWTATGSMSWHEKNPVKWAAFLVVAGAVASAVVAIVTK
jgi:hypothetical protein